jgi:two-component system response regulator TtrR
MNKQTSTPLMTPVLYIVDDDKAVRDSLCWLLESINYQVRAYDSGETFLEDYSIHMRGCLLLDIRMPGMSGLQLQQQLNQHPFTMPIIFVTGHGDVPMAVQAMKQGAYDFVEKPFNDQSLLDKIQLALQIDKENAAKRLEYDSIQARLTTLTRREHEILQLITQRYSNKMLADKLNISIKTVEAHRSHLMEKMRVSNYQELTDMLTHYSIRL